jgi:hypothetical protein
MADGYDDSSTFWSREVVDVFATHYPEENFNCSYLADNENPATKTFLTWGNSWMEGNCGWRYFLKVSYFVLSG